MMDRLLRLSMLPICISMSVGVYILWPESDSVDSGKSSRTAETNSEKVAPHIESFPIVTPLPLDAGDTSLVELGQVAQTESVDLTDRITQDWESGIAESETPRVAQEAPAGNEQMLTLTDARPGRQNPYFDETATPDDRAFASNSNTQETTRFPETDSQGLLVPTETNREIHRDAFPSHLASAQTNPHSFSDQRLDGTQALNATPHAHSPNQNQHQVVERFPVQSTTNLDPTQGAIEPPARPDTAAAFNASQRPVQLPEHVVTRLRRQVEQAATLARKGALYSARNEFVHALYLVAEARDSMLGSRLSTLHLERALTALRESDDFTRSHQAQDTHLDIARIVGRHETKVLEGELGNPITPLEAMRRYYEFAGANLVRAYENEPIASEALHSLGKLYIMPGGLGENGEAYAVPKAVVYFQSSVMVDPNNSRSANELGVQLARLGEWAGAKQAFLQSVAARPSVTAWQNLSVVHNNLNEVELAALAMNEAETLSRAQQQNPQAQFSTAAGSVEFISPHEFASQSPIMGPTPDGYRDPESTQQNARPQPTTARGNFWDRIWQ